MVGQDRLLAVQRIGNAQWSAMPQREQVLDIGGMIGQRLHSRHIREVERRRLIGELISIDRNLRSEDFIESSLVANSRVGPDPIPGQLRALEGAEWIDGQNFRCRSLRIRRRDVGRVDEVQILLRGRRGAKRVARVGEVLVIAKPKFVSSAVFPFIKGTWLNRPLVKSVSG